MGTIWKKKKQRRRRRRRKKKETNERKDLTLTGFLMEGTRRLFLMLGIPYSVARFYRKELFYA